jgi:hypothetical protein
VNPAVVTDPTQDENGVCWVDGKGPRAERTQAEFEYNKHHDGLIDQSGGDLLGAAGGKLLAPLIEDILGSLFARLGVGTGANVAVEAATDEIYVIGHGSELALQGVKGFNVLNARGWTLAMNDAWVQSGIDAGRRFLVTDLQTGANLYSERFGASVFARELNQLNAAGYTQVGNMMVPPGFKLQ